MKQTMTLETAAGYIRRDPASWKGISLFYARPVSGTPFPAPDATSFMGKNGDVIMLGLDRPPAIPPEAVSACVWISDIGRQQALAESILSAATQDRPPSPDAGEQALPPDKALSILIVEDDPLISRMVALHLERFGTVTTTTNSREAVANYMVRRPDIIFLDIHYREDKGDGFDVLHNLLSADKDAFVVMVSGDQSPTTVLKALRLGAQGFIAKPFQASDFSHYLIKLHRHRG